MSVAELVVVVGLLVVAGRLAAVALAVVAAAQSVVAVLVTAVAADECYFGFAVVFGILYFLLFFAVLLPDGLNLPVAQIAADHASYFGFVVDYL